MKKIYVAFIALMLCGTLAQAQRSFEKNYGSTNTDWDGFFDIIELDNHQLVAAGYTPINSGIGDYNSWVMHLDSAGNQINSYNFGNVNDQGLYRIRQTSTGSFVGIGYDNSASGNYEMMVLKLDGSFQEDWSANLGVSLQNWDERPIYDIVESVNGDGYIVAGSNIITSGSDHRAFIAKIDTVQGDTVWTRSFSNPSYLSDIYSIDVTADGAYIMAGKAFGTKDNILLIKVDDNGNKLFEQTLSAPSDQSAFDVLAEDDGFILAGKIRGGSNDFRNLILKSNLTGTSALWSTTLYDGVTNWDETFSVSKTHQGDGYVITGYTGGPSNDKALYVVKTNNSGTQQWSEKYGDTKGDAGYSVIATYDGGIAIAGYTENPTTSNQDAIITKIDAGGQVCDFFPVVQQVDAPAVAGFTPTTFSATITSGNGALSYDWNGDNGFSSTDPSPSYTFPAGMGSYAYTLEVTDANSCTGLYTDSVSVLENADTTDYIADGHTALSIYPNPFDQAFYIENTSDSPVAFRLFDHTGRLVFTTSLMPGTHAVELTLPSGMYHYDLVGDKRVSGGTIVRR